MIALECDKIKNAGRVTGAAESVGAAKEPTLKH